MKKVFLTLLGLTLFAMTFAQTSFTVRIENVSDAEILQSLEFLNQAFANVGEYQNENGVDTKIQFCLAQ